jgi:hypothetical protein
MFGIGNVFRLVGVNKSDAFAIRTIAESLEHFFLGYGPHGFLAIRERPKCFRLKSYLS